MTFLFKAASKPAFAWLCVGWALCAALVLGAYAFWPAIGWLLILAELLRIGAFAIATLLCWRNAKEDAIVSGQIVWQAIALGLCFYALGDTVALLWHLLWGLSTTAPLRDVFHGVSYLLLSIGLFNAVLPRQTSLSIPQTLSIAAVGIFGILFASWVNLPTGEPSSLSDIAARHVAEADQAPAIVQTIDTRLLPIADKMDLLYIAGDCILIVVAGALLVAFWGGTYAKAWRLIALAGLCLYTADMFMIYHSAQDSYAPGSLWEIFWIASALLFGAGASVEHRVSTQMQEKRSQPQWI